MIVLIEVVLIIITSRRRSFIILTRLLNDFNFLRNYLNPSFLALYIIQSLL
jgi:hypothetical protein